MESSRSVLVFSLIGALAALLLLTPVEPYLEGLIAIGMVAIAVAGFFMYPRREVFYVRTSLRLVDADRNKTLERDFLAVRVQLARLWLLFVPTFLAVALLVFSFAAGGPMKFSYLQWISSSRYWFPVFLLWQYPPLLILVLLWAWIDERRVMRDAEACSARAFSVSRRMRGGWIRRVSYQFMGDQGEYYGGDCVHFGFVHSRELATVVFYDIRKPELNRIAMGFLFHRFIVVGRGVTELDKQTVAAQIALAEITSSS